MNELLPTNLYSDVRTPVQPIYQKEVSEDYKQLVSRIDDIQHIENVQMPLAFGTSFLIELEHQKMMHSMPMRLPGMETASMSKQILMGDDDDMLLEELHPEVDYCYPTFSVHETIEKEFF